MGAEKLVEKAAKILAMPYEDVYRMIGGAFDGPDPQNILLDALGYDNVDLVFSLVQNKNFFEEKEIKNEEPKYVEYIIPSSKTVFVSERDLVQTADTGDNSRFFQYKRFNAVQSQVYPAAYSSDENLLVCAPTGAGKTDIALLTILRALKDPKAKIIYVVPMKALASEITRKYSEVFSKTEIRVIEYTGDTEIDSEVARLANIVICTPEKFDVSTRRHSSVFSNIRLFIADEIHLLGDSRGPVLEILVARMFRMSELSQRIIRIVGLSATLPNYRDVGRFIRATAVFHFGPMYRPVPLEVTVTGFKKGSKIMDEEEYLTRKVTNFRANKHQVLVFIHSRAHTVKVAKMLVSKLLGCAPEDKKILLEDEFTEKTGKKGTRSETGFTGILDVLVRNKIGVHHAGLPRSERLAMEECFKKGKIDILICTSTLAWGVNLPAHAVMIYGTSFYNPDRGTFDDVGILDIIQIFGRAGRPQYDTTGEAILISKANKLDKYLALLHGSKDVESSLLHHVTDAISAEIYLSNIFSVSTALLWIKSTFFYVRMMKNPSLYGLNASENAAVRLGGISLSGEGKHERFSAAPDETVLSDYILLALKRLESCGLILINKRVVGDHNTWVFESTFFGRIASFYYLSHLTMHLWLGNLESFTSGETSILLLLLKSEEFGNISLRDDEISFLEELHLSLLKAREIDIDFEASLECKLITLIAAYFAYIRPQLFSLLCDTDFIVENLQRMLSALKEILLYLKRYEAYKTVLCLERRLWRVRAVGGLDCSFKSHYCGKFIDLSVSVFTSEARNVKIKDVSGSAFGSKVSRSAKNAGIAKNDGCIEIKTKNNKPSGHKSVGNYKNGAISNSSILLYKNSELVYAAEFKEYFRDYVYCPGDADSIEVYAMGRHMRAPLYSEICTSMADLYYYGVHYCDSVFSLAGTPPSCPHFASAHATHSDNASSSDAPNSGKSRDKVHGAGTNMDKSAAITRLDKHSVKTTYNNEVETFCNLDIQFIPISIPLIKERLKVIDSKIYKISGSVLVICSGSPKVVTNEINTRLALDGNFRDMFECGAVTNKSLVHKRWIAGLHDSRGICDQFEWIIFRGCSSGRSYYPVYEIFEICNGRKAIIYECGAFIEYLKEVIRIPNYIGHGLMP